MDAQQFQVNPAEVRELIRIATRRTGAPVFDEDLTQEVSLRALEAMRRAGHIEHPRAFLMKIVSDAVRDHWRKRRPVEALDAIDERLVCVRPDFEGSLDFARRSAALNHALAGLELSKRRLINLYYDEGLSVAEIARLQNRSIPSVKMALCRIRREIAGKVGIRPHKKSRLL